MSIHGIFDEDGARLGTVMKIAGEPASRRWWAYAVYPRGRAPDNENKAGFPTQKAAVAWLKEQRANAET